MSAHGYRATENKPTEKWPKFQNFAEFWRLFDKNRLYFFVHVSPYIL
jgi:hypothetical protein